MLKKWWKKSRAPLLEADMIRVATMMELGLRSGRDWLSIVMWISQCDASSDVRSYFLSLSHRLKLDSLEKCLKNERSRSTDLLWKLFVENLLQAHRGALHLSALFKTFAEIGRRIVSLKEKEKSLLFVPKFQSWTSLFIIAAFVFGLPSLAPGLFPTFLTLHRFDLFVSGLVVAFCGFGILLWLCAQPQKRLVSELFASFFYYFLSLQLEAGSDFVTAWYRALENVPLPPKLYKNLNRKELSTETMDDFLSSLRSRLPAPWPEILTGILWAKNSGIGLSRFLKDCSAQEADRLLLKWEDEIRKLTMIALLPLGLMIFPATLFLLVGPQLFELVTTL
jgi:hypothetical protein